MCRDWVSGNPAACYAVAVCFRPPGSNPGRGVMATNVCSACKEEAFRHVPLGETTSIDTIGSVRICVTEDGAYFHGTR
jgi:hypothetical protein